MSRVLDKNILHPIVLIEIADQHLRHVQRSQAAKALASSSSSSSSSGTASSAAASSAPFSSSTSSLSSLEIPCVGMIFGIRKENDRVEIFSSIEAKVNEIPASSSSSGVTQFLVDESLISIHTMLTTQVFPMYELLGWYLAATSFSQSLSLIHNQFRKYTKNPILLLVSPSKISEGTRELPVQLLQEQVEDAVETNSIATTTSAATTTTDTTSTTTATTSPIMNNIDMQISTTKTSVISLPYRLEAAEHERICIDHVTSSVTQRTKRGIESTSAMIELRSQASALKVLLERIQVLKAFVGACEQGKIPLEGGGGARTILRQIGGLCAQRPITTSSDTEFAFQRAHDQEDTLMIALLASITRGVNTLSSVTEKLSLLKSAEKRTFQRGLGGSVGDRDMIGGLIGNGGGGGGMLMGYPGGEGEGGGGGPMMGGLFGREKDRRPERRQRGAVGPQDL